MQDKDIYHLMTVFCEVVDAGSFTAASNKLGIQTPAVSKAIGKLERRLGKKLIHRSTRKLECSDAGRFFYNECVQQLTQIEALKDKMLCWEDEPKGALKMTATVLVGDYIISPILSEFSKHFPHIVIELLFVNEIIKLPSQNIDIAFRSSETLEDSTLRSIKIMEMERCLVASPSFIEDHPAPLQPSDLANFDTINFFHNKVFDNWKYLSAEGSIDNHVSSKVTCNNYSSIKLLCLNGMGIARLYKYQVEREVRDGTLQLILPDYDWGRQFLHAVYHERLSDSPKIAAFINFLKKRSSDKVVTIVSE